MSYKSHIELAHDYWKALIRPGDTVVDATCGNGHDSLLLAKLALTPDSGNLYVIDKQSTAIEATRARLAAHLPAEHLTRVIFAEQCHSTFPSAIAEGSAKLIVYNLGYLPGGDKQVTTLDSSTLESLTAALKLITQSGCISVTAYPGHAEGEREEQQVLNFAAQLDPRLWSCCHHRWLNRAKAPSLLLIQRVYILVA